MAILTHIDLADAQRIGSEYGLSITAIAGLLAGSVNTNYACTLAGGGRAFLRIYEEQDARGAEREIKLLKHLSSRGVPTVCPMLRASDRDVPTLSSFGSKAAAIFPWVDGEVLCQSRVTEHRMTQVGSALAKMHVAGADFPGAEKSRFNVKHLQGRIERLRAEGYGRLSDWQPVLGGDLGADVEMLAVKLSAYAEREAIREAKEFRSGAASTTGALVHGDVFRDNVLWKGEEMAAMLDFESASLGAITFDLCVTMLAWCMGDELERPLARAFVAGYTKERPLTPEELDRLHDDAIFAALRFSITRITDYELRPKGTGQYKSYKRFLKRLATIESLGEKGLLELLGLR
ncbi:MAG: homoserine kinase [Polyangiaceae bacterium]